MSNSEKGTYYVEISPENKIDFSKETAIVKGHIQRNEEKEAVQVILNTSKHQPYYQDNAISLRVQGVKHDSEISASIVQFHTKVENLQGTITSISQTNPYQIKLIMDLKDQQQSKLGTNAKQNTITTYAKIGNHNRAATKGQMTIKNIILSTGIGKELEVSGYAHLDKNGDKTLNLSFVKKLQIDQEQSSNQSIKNTDTKKDQQISV